MFCINTSPEKTSNPENIVNSKYHDSGQIQTLKFPEKHRFLCLIPY